MPCCGQKASIPPSYGDLGKSARDLFSKGFNYGFYKLDVTSTTAKGISFKPSLKSVQDSGKVHGDLETKYKCKDYGLTLVKKWNTDNVLGAEVTVEDQLAKGLKITFDSSFAPETGKKSGKIKTGYKQNQINVNADFDLNLAGPKINGSAVVGYCGWLAGYQMAFDTAKKTLTKNNFSVGYLGGDYTINASVNDGAEFAGNIHRVVSKELEAGVQVSWSSGSNATVLGVAAKYIPDKDSVFRAKLNNSSQLGLSYQQKISDGITGTASILLEGKNINAGGHKLGFGLEFGN